MFGLLILLVCTGPNLCDVIEYDWHIPTVECCIEYIARCKAVSGSGHFGLRNVNRMWRK